MPIKVSILMLAYNHEQFIAQAIESALAQKTNFDFELVIGEDCSTDATRAVIDRYADANPGRIRKIYRDKNVGMTRNFCETYAALSGQYGAMLEGDDYWTDPEKLQMQVNALDAHPEWSTCFHPVKWLLPDGRPGIETPFQNDRKPVYGLKDIVGANFVGSCSAVFRTGLIQQFPDWLDSLRMCDWPLHLLNARHGQIGMIDRVMAVYRVHAGGAWSMQGELKNLQSTLNAYDCFEKFLGPEFQDIFRTKRSMHLGTAINVSLKNNDYAQARIWLARYFREGAWKIPGIRSRLPKILYDCYLRPGGAASRAH